MSKKDVIKPGHFKPKGKPRPSKAETTELNKEHQAREKAVEARMPGPQPAAPGRRKGGTAVGTGQRTKSGR